MNFSAISIETLRLRKRRITLIPCPFVLLSMRKLRLDYNFKLLLRTKIKVLRMKKGLIFKKILCDIINKKDCSGASIKSFDDWSERLLTSSIPDLHFDWGIFIDADNFRIELDSKCGCISLLVKVFGEPIQEATFSDSWRADDDHFEGLVLWFHDFYCK